MNANQAAAYVIAQAAMLSATCAGMVAENQIRAYRGESPAYGDDAFQDEINKSCCHHNAVIGLFNACME